MATYVSFTSHSNHVCSMQVTVPLFEQFTMSPTVLVSATLLARFLPAVASLIVIMNHRKSWESHPSVPELQSNMTLAATLYVDGTSHFAGLVSALRGIALTTKAPMVAQFIAGIKAETSDSAAAVAPTSGTPSCLAGAHHTEDRSVHVVA